MSYTKKYVFAALPRTQRGTPLVLGGDPKGRTFLYTNGNSVIIRDIENPAISDVYTEHSCPVNVAKYSPSGFYIASGGSNWSPSGNVNNEITISRKELFVYLQTNKYLSLTQSECVERLCDYVINKFGENKNLIAKNMLKTKLKSFVNNLFVKYRQCNRFAKKLLLEHKQWIEQPFATPFKEIHSRLVEPTPKQGRPRKLFQCSSSKTKSRAVSALVTQEEPSKLLFASRQSLRLAGKRNASKVIEIASSASPRTLKRMKTVGLSSEHHSEHTTYSPDEALALMVDNDMTKDDYTRMQQGAKCRGCNLYPPYKIIQKAKLQCYPEPGHINVSENGVEVSLQTLLDFTMERLFLVQKDVFTRIEEIGIDQVKVLCKWGFDGSGGHSVYKQNFSDTNSLYGDSNIILCSVVLLEIANNESTNRLIFWKAASSSATRFCRPLMFKILHETKENVLDMYNTVQSQIQSLLPKQMIINGKQVLFHYVLMPTMFDVKIINILTNNKSTQSCYVCKAKASEMNNIEKVSSKSCDKSSFQYGLSVLHGYIRTMELLLHISYKLHLKKWQARGELEKKSVAERKTMISQKFYQDMGLVVDVPKQGGGNSNDGNTARRFFSNPAKVAEITGLDEEIIYRFATILGTLASGYTIKFKEFKKYCLDTAKKYVLLYNWYNMSVTVHKILFHGPDIINNLALPIGTLTEDIQESRQKDFKNYRLFHTRKTSRINTNTDIFNLMLVTTDPVIVLFREKPKKKSKPFNKDIVFFFQEPLKENMDENDDDDRDDSATE